MEGLLTVAVVVGLVSPLLLLPPLLDDDDDASATKGFGAGAGSSMLLFSLKSMRFLVFCPEAEVLASSGSVLTLIQDPS